MEDVQAKEDAGRSKKKNAADDGTFMVIMEICRRMEE
jgi:hypothetical protein